MQDEVFSCDWCGSKVSIPEGFKGWTFTQTVDGKTHFCRVFKQRTDQKIEARRRAWHSSASEAPVELWSTVVDRYAEIWARIKPEKLEQETA